MDGRNLPTFPGLVGPPRTTPQNINPQPQGGISQHPIPLMNLNPNSRSPPPLLASSPMILNNPPQGHFAAGSLQLPAAAHGQPVLGGLPVQQAQQFPPPLLPHIHTPEVVRYPPPRPMHAANTGMSEAPLVLNPAPPNPHLGIVGSSNQLIPSNKQRVFTGSVTKMLDTFGFVEEEVFFQFDVIKGVRPKVGEKVLVEASFNPNMPFKWNANRIQVLPNQQKDNDVPGSVMPPLMLNTDIGNQPIIQNWQVSQTQPQHPPQHPQQPSQQQQTLQQTLPPQKSPAVALPPRLRAGARGVLTPTTADRERVKAGLKSGQGFSEKRESSPESESSRGHGKENFNESVSRESSPSSGRKRPDSPLKSLSDTKPDEKVQSLKTFPRYYVKVPKFSTVTKDVDVVSLKSRYPNLYIPSDFFSAFLFCNSTFDNQHPFPIVQANAPPSFQIRSEKKEDQTESFSEPEDVTHQFVAKVMLLSFPCFKELCSRTISSENSHDDLVHASKCFEFLVGLKNKHEIMAIGGPWSPSEDGANPDSDPKVLIRTAIRTTKSLTGIDLSRCTTWYKFLEIYYFRPEETYRGKPVAARTETVVIFLPDIWNSVADTQNRKEGIRFRMRVRMELPNEDGEIKDLKLNDSETLGKNLQDPDPKKMKVEELRQELKKRNLPDQGLKTQLIARLQKALKSEQDVIEEKDELLSKINTKVLISETIETVETEAGVSRDQNSLEPAILVYPNHAAKTGKFDCSVKSLSYLLNYKQDDQKESSFEVSLFSELFYEMLLRDQGMKIFQALTLSAENGKIKEEPPVKKLKTEPGQELDAVKNVGPLKTDIQSLFAFTFFDLNRCGYLEDRDVEDILSILGLNLSKSQIRRLIAKVFTRDYLSYRKFCTRDRPDDDELLPGDQGKRCENVGNSASLSNLEDSSLFRSSFVERSTVETEGVADPYSPVRTNAGGKSTMPDDLVSYRGDKIDLEDFFHKIAVSETRKFAAREKAKAMEKELAGLKEDNERLEAEREANKGRIQDLKKDLEENGRELDKTKAKSVVLKDALHSQQKSLQSRVDEMSESLENSAKNGS